MSTVHFDAEEHTYIDFLYFSIGFLWIPDGILKHPRGATPRVGVLKCHWVSIANQQKNITVTHLYQSRAYVVFTLTLFEMDFSCLYGNRYLQQQQQKNNQNSKNQERSIQILVSLSLDEDTSFAIVP